MLLFLDGVFAFGCCLASRAPTVASVAYGSLVAVAGFAALAVCTVR